MNESNTFKTFSPHVLRNVLPVIFGTLIALRPIIAPGYMALQPWLLTSLLYDGAERVVPTVFLIAVGADLAHVFLGLFVASFGVARLAKYRLLFAVCAVVAALPALVLAISSLA